MAFKFNMTSKTFVIGDIHGGLKALKQVLQRAEITPNHRLIFLGDYVDGWNDTLNLLDFLIELKQTQDCIFLMGNHEEMLLKWLTQGEDNELWRFHGGQSTVDLYQTAKPAQKAAHIAFLKELKPYHLDQENRLFVHAGFTNFKGVTAEYFTPLFWWDRTLWEMALALDPNLSMDALTYPTRLKLYKEIFIGHTPVTRIDSSIPVQAANVWNLDTGAAFKGKLSLMDVDSKTFWQSDNLPILYPNEKGRN